MRKITRIQEITVETRSVTIIRTTSKPSSLFCDNCRTSVSAFVLSEIAAALQLSTTEIEALILSGEIHAITPGTQLICDVSLAEFLRRINR